MNIIDSSGWLEYFADGPNAAFFPRPLQKTSQLIVPTITMYEVFKAVLRQRNESDAIQSVALMQQGTVVDLTPGIAILAAKLSMEHQLPMADSIILATARTCGAIIWTQDSDFKHFTDVRYPAKQSQ
ncbi:MAG TPA: type II toxin-antitoxin system VapC family toxin [Dissulfurispiraceae bacterium]|nr:type II toxin-antitoxin system VapC family toxin [Dissulfurispiraceae bacterium]